VLASSIQVEWGHPAGVQVSVEMAPIPSNVYAASKAFAEAAGHAYHAQWGLEVVCLRLGLVAIPAKLDRLLATGSLPSRHALCAGDCAEILARSVETPGIGFAVLPAYSRNAAATRDLAPLERVLGFTPQEDAFVLWPKRRRLRDWRYYRWQLKM